MFLELGEGRFFFVVVELSVRFSVSISDPILRGILGNFGVNLGAFGGP